MFRLATTRMKINQIPYDTLKTTSQFSFKFCITFQCHHTYTYFLAQTLYALDKKYTIKVQFSKLLSALMKIYSIPHAIFESTRSVFIQILYKYSVS